MRFVIAICIMLECAVHGSAPPHVRCVVREASQPSSEAREFQPPLKQGPVGKGFLVTAATREVERGHRIDLAISDRTGTERELVVEFRLLATGRWTKVFVTDGRGVRALGDSGRVRYRGQCALPAITILGREAGLTIAAPFEVPAPRLGFSWRKTEAGVELTAVVRNLRLPAGGRVAAGLLVARHEPCWRPGLGWLVGLYPEYFHPPNPKVWDYDGPMIYDFVTSEERLRRDLEQDLRWQELGWYWPHLGLYLPEGEAWRRQPRSEGGKGKGGPVTRQMLRDYIALSNRLGVAQCLYFQSTESWGEYAARRFPDCRYRRANGALAPTWVKCVVMDPNPDRPFGRHILDQLQQLVAAFPGMAGVFWDQNAYVGFDFAHDDGITTYKGKRVSMMEFPQNKILERGAKFLHDRGKVIFTNGGWTMGLARYCDGHMSEGTRPTRRLQYTCMMKHLTLLAYDSNIRRGREKLMLALETGAQPSVTLGNDACRKMFMSYRPIFRMLQRKQWVFHPRALALPEGIAGNIFRNGEGNYVVTVVESASAHPTPAQRLRPVGLSVQLPDAGEIGCVFEMSPQARGLRTAQVVRGPGGFTAKLPRPEAGAALLLARRGRWIGAGALRLIAGRERELELVFANFSDAPWRGQWRVTVGERETTHNVATGPFKTTRVPLGPVTARPADDALTVTIVGPGPERAAQQTVIDIPVVSAIALRTPEGVTQVLKGEQVEFAIANRLDEAIAVSVRTRWSGGAASAHEQKLRLGPGAVETLHAGTAAAASGLRDLSIVAESAYGRVAQAMKVDVIETVLPKDFRVEDVAGLTLRMDIFNSLAGKWADKPVKVNGVAIGQLPITGQTLRWHEGMEMQIDAAPARAALVAGRRKDGEIRLLPTVDNRVKNCFKIRRVQATIRMKSGEAIQSTWTHEVRCSASGWLYSEGKCARIGEPMPMGVLRFLPSR